MKIGLDAGGVCAKKENRFGNYTFTVQLINALKQYDKHNDYILYSFCKKSSSIPTWIRGHYRYLLPTKGWMKLRVSLEEFLHPSNCFLSLNQAIPLLLKTKPIVFLHGLSFHFFPQYYPDSYNALEDQLLYAARLSKYIVVSSEKVRQELRMIFPQISNIVVLPFGIPFDMLKTKSIRKARKKYFLFVAMNHPIKNVKFILKTFRKFISLDVYKDYQLYLVGPYDLPGEKNVRVFRTMSRNNLKKLYQEATALLTSSHYESFNFPVLEALSQNCQVIGTRDSIIPELRKYAHVKSREATFLHCMEKVAIGQKKNIEISKLKKEFSWKKYILKLISLY